VTVGRGDSVEDMTHERAVELLAEKRARGPVAKRYTRRAPAKKGTAKKATAKKSATKKT
jgi:DNA topoisomerase-1